MARLQELANELLVEAKLLFEAIDTKSREIKKIEDELIKLKINLPYNHQFDQEYSFSWFPVNDQKKFRLLLVRKVGDEVVLSQPFIETKLDLRMQYIPFIPGFLKGMKENIEKYRREAQDIKLIM